MVGSPSFRNLFTDAFLAAREFGAFLIRNNLIEASDLPILQCQEPEVIYLLTIAKKDYVIRNLVKENENICPLFENCAIESHMSTIQSVSPKTEHEALEGSYCYIKMRASTTANMYIL